MAGVCAKTASNVSLREQRHAVRPDRTLGNHKQTKTIVLQAQHCEVTRPARYLRCTPVPCVTCTLTRA